MANELITPHEEQTLENEFALGAIVKRSVGSSIYETHIAKDGNDRHPALIRIYETEEGDWEPVVKRWKQITELSHPHLLRVYAAGFSKMEGVAVAYCVTEHADQSLANVLEQRALSGEEVQEMLEPTVSALQYLHKNGYAHGTLNPANVLAAGDRLKLSSESVTKVSEGGIPTEDLRALGALILEALAPGYRQAEPSGNDNAGARFGEIVRGCMALDPARRWTADRVADRLHNRDVVPEVPEPLSVSASAPAEKPRSLPFPNWALAALAALALVIAVAAVLRKKDLAATPAVAPTAVVQQAPTAAAPVEPPVVHAASRHVGGWSVIAAAYGSRAAADKRAGTLAAKWSGFHVSVTDHPGERARYLVVLGDQLSQAEAESLKLRAVRAGLPRDTYIKKLK